MSMDPIPHRYPEEGHLQVMPIINVSADSFSGDGFDGIGHDKPWHSAIQGVLDSPFRWIDIGAKSTRPDHGLISVEDEWNRLLPILSSVPLHERFRISVDTSSPEVAQKALSHGVGMINDVEGTRQGPRNGLLMCQIIEAFNAQWLLMHNNRPGMGGTGHSVDSVCKDLERCVEDALQHGLKRENVWVDPGLGFGKDMHASWELLCGLSTIRDRLGCRLVLGHSRKSFLTRIDSRPAGDRDHLSVALVGWAYTHGIDMVRMHNWREAQYVVDAWSTLSGGRPRPAQGDG